MIFPPLYCNPFLNTEMLVADENKAHKRNKQLLIYFKPLINLIFPFVCCHCKRELLCDERYVCWCCEEEMCATFFAAQQAPTTLDKLFWGRVNIQNTHALFYFQKGKVSQTILHEIKYGFKGSLGVVMGKKMASAIIDNYAVKTIDALIPVPTHHRKKFNRGYNQSEKIAMGISAVTKIPIDTSFIRKIKNTTSQTKKSKTERLINVEGGFESVKFYEKYKHIAIVDDVITTGATLEVLIKEIRKSNPNIEISIFVLAMAL